MNKTQLLSKTKAELLKVAQRLGLRGVTTLKKTELADRVYEAQQQKTAPVARQPMGINAVARKVAAAAKRRAVRKLAPVVPRTPVTQSQTPAKVAVQEPVAEIDVAGEELSAHKFDVVPAPPPPRQVFIEEHLGELPEAYGTGRLFLTARDPHWLFAYWDLSWQQMADYRGQASDGRLVLRVFEKNHPNPIQELSLAHDTRNWYIPVNKAATTYTAQLGYWRPDGSFHVVGQSREATTPADVVSPETSARFATIPIDITFRELFDLIRGHTRDGERLAEALQRLQATGFRFPFKIGVEVGPWTAQQQAEMERILGGDIFRRIQIGSFEISEWLRRRMQEEVSSGMFSAFSPHGTSWPGGAQEKGFWFAVNAELVIYGATEPGAKVTVDGKPVTLRSDGTFSFQYAFPDGQYRLPVVAVSASGDDRRTVELSFERRTKTKGEVGKVKQPGHLKAPAAA
jgi:hypothetical protein